MRFLARKIFLLAACISCLGHWAAEAQQIDRKSTYLMGIYSQATGRYGQALANANAIKGFVGLGYGYLVNTRKDITSPLFIGGEAGVLAMGTDAVSAANGATVTATNSTWWLMGVARYRPMTWASTFNPFADLSAGPKVVGAGLYEQVSAEESVRITGISSVALAYGLGVGVGIKIPKQEGPNPYLDISLHYQHTQPFRLMERNSARVLSNGEANFIKAVMPTPNWQLRVSFTRFR